MFDFESQRDRSHLYTNIRSYFIAKNYLEVFTAEVSTSLIPEPTIKCFKTEFTNEFVGNKELYLIPSPEIFMKEMIANGSGSIFQISSCFRNSEQLGNIHNPEFTMLEYYTMDYSDSDSIDLTIDMIEKTAISKPSWLKNKPLVITVEEAMWEYAKVDLIKCQEKDKLREEANRLNLIIPESENWEDTFNKIFITYIEPSLPLDREVYLRDYPKQIECLAKNYPNRPYKKRWEMYINGIEIANCYDEESDKEKIKNYYLEEQKKLEEERKMTNEAISKVDPNFPLLDMPQCSGVAIGLDRLLMVEKAIKDIDKVLSFPLSVLLKRG